VRREEEVEEEEEEDEEEEELVVNASFGFYLYFLVHIFIYYSVSVFSSPLPFFRPETVR